MAILSKIASESTPSEPPYHPTSEDPPPSPDGPRGSTGNRYDVVTKGIALALYYHLPGPSNIEKFNKIEQQTGVKQRALRDIRNRALERGFDPTVDQLRIKKEHLGNAPRSGPPCSAVNSKNEKLVIQIVSKDKNGREKSAEVIGIEIGISRQSVYRIMKKLGYKKVKYITKPGLNEV